MKKAVPEGDDDDVAIITEFEDSPRRTIGADDVKISLNHKDVNPMAASAPAKGLASFRGLLLPTLNVEEVKNDDLAVNPSIDVNY